MSLNFTKMQGLGNDFVVLDQSFKSRALKPRSSEIKMLCDRKTGVGADQLLLIGPPSDKSKYDFRLTIWNQDGKKAKMCGNGLRCVAHYVKVSKRSNKKILRWQTDSGLRKSELLKLKGEESFVSVQMGKFKLLSKDPLEIRVPKIKKKLRGFHISMGNPHFVLFGITQKDRKIIGEALQTHRAFPGGVNVIFPSQPSNLGRSIDLEIYERGAGFTQACGSGACAGAVAAVIQGFSPTKSLIQMNLPGGILKVLVNRETREVEQRGPSVLVFKGMKK